MRDPDAFREALRYDEPGPSRRELRAQATVAYALSPTRILRQVLFAPFVAIAVCLTIYTLSSPFGREDAMRHLAAMGGCEMSAKLGLAPAYRGQLGYHTRNDPDANGIACETAQLASLDIGTEGLPAQDPSISDSLTNIAAKFLRP